MKKLLLKLFCLSLLFSCNDAMKEKLPDGDSDIFLYETYELRELFEALDSANTYLKSISVINEKTHTNEKVEEPTLLNDILESEDSVSAFEEFANENSTFCLCKYNNIMTWSIDTADEQLRLEYGDDFMIPLHNLSSI